jgi:predicted nuclease with TOPRIM domain
MKTGLARKLDPERPDMEPAEEIKLLTQVAELRSDVRHVQGDVADIKTEQRARFDKVDKQFDKVDKQFDKVEEKFKAVDARLNEIVKMISSAQLWAYGLYAALTFTLLYVIARSAKWL